MQPKDVPDSPSRLQALAGVVDRRAAVDGESRAGLEALVAEARYGMAAKAPQLRRHPPSRRIATLLATVVYLEARYIDDCLELFDLLMVTELVGKAEREAKKERVRQHPRLARASAKLAAAVEVLLEATSRGEAVALDDLWELIEAVVPRTELQAAIASVAGMSRRKTPTTTGRCWRAWRAAS